MADVDKNKEMFERAYLAGEIQFPKDVQAFLDRNPKIRDKALGDLQRRKIEIDTLFTEINRLQQLENNRLRNAKLSLEAVQGAWMNALKTGDERTINLMQQRVDQATQAASTDPQESRHCRQRARGPDLRARAGLDGPQSRHLRSAPSTRRRAGLWDSRVPHAQRDRGRRDQRRQSPGR